ncbi:MAG: SDR family oxidoreductase [Bacteroidota bacterium]|nr:SDR family oxidoreductase [Bacteroidota bacterium]MDP4204641.1 SDR family oxidoreductase [Bacteroidota bacterium]
MKIELKGKVALITGSSRGIGRAIAIALAEEGVNLVLTGTKLDLLTHVAAECLEKGVTVLVAPADMTKETTPDYLVNTIKENFSRLDFLINNAGIAFAKPLAETTPEDWDRVITTNAKAPYFLSQRAIPLLRQSENATIINISSVVGRKGYENQSAYAASKHALMGWSKALAREVLKDKIRVHTIAPGGVETDMVTKTRPDLDTSILIKPEEIAEWIVFLLSHRGNAMTDEINIRRALNTPFD